MIEVRRIDGQDVEFALIRLGTDAAVVFHGGHLRAELDLGHESFLEAGLSVLQPSRPGYGRTPIAAGPDLAGFSDRVALLSRELGFQRVCAVGISGGGRTAMTFSARHPELVRGLVLESSVSFAPWPDGAGVLGRLALRAAFNRVTEPLVWAILRAAFRLAPRYALGSMMRSLSTLPTDRVVDSLTDREGARLRALFSRMRSGRGFLRDLRPAPDVTREIGQPTLIVASRNDGAVLPAHSLRLAHSIGGAELVLLDSESHLLWVGPHAAEERRAVEEFLAAL